MYPDVVLLGMTLYEILIVVGVIYAMAVFRLISDRDKAPARYQNLVIICALVGVVGGYTSAMLFQSVYNFIATGDLIIDAGTGTTFYGGLIGGAAFFLLIYFVAGHILFKDRYHLTHFVRLTDVAAGSIAGAHAFGRLGCLTAGCCHGARTESWIGIYNKTLGYDTVPIQLFEAIFLFGLSAFLIYRCVKGKTYGLPAYLSAYGVWRFIIEYFRADERGETIIKLFTPSQLIALLLIAVGVAMAILVKKFYKGEKNEK